MSQYFPQVIATLKIVWENFGDPSELLRQTTTMEVQCRRARVTINSYSEADTFELELDYKHFPFDPRTIRSCQVSIHMEDMEQLTDEFGNRVTIEPTEENAMFQGFADEGQITLDDSTRTVRMKGRDFTGIYTDAKSALTRVPLDLPVDQVVSKIISSLKASGDIEVDNRTGETLPVLARFYPDFEGTLSGGRNARKNETYWDVIQDIVSKAGLICYMELDKLVITKPQTLYDNTNNVKFAYGRNIKNLELTRKLGKQKGFNILVRSVSTVTKQVLEADIPKDSKNLDIRGAPVLIPKQSTRGQLVKGEEERAPTLSFNVANVNDRDHLIEIGEKIFEELGRQQIEGRFTTMELLAPQGVANQDTFDLLGLRIGTPIEVYVDVDDLANIQKEANQGKRFTYLVQKGYAPQIATIFAETMGKYTTPFYTRSADFSIDADSGLRIDVDFVNFIETAGKGFSL